eukprot:366395-Chlamydomonas_euryale.AAC.10
MQRDTLITLHGRQAGNAPACQTVVARFARLWSALLDTLWQPFEINAARLLWLAHSDIVLPVSDWQSPLAAGKHANTSAETVRLLSPVLSMVCMDIAAHLPQIELQEAWGLQGSRFRDQRVTLNPHIPSASRIPVVCLTSLLIA